MSEYQVCVPSTTLPAPVAAPSEGQPRLTPRQREICALLRQGMPNKRIAAALRLSEGTVKNHITEILRALRVSNRTQAACHPIEL